MTLDAAVAAIAVEEDADASFDAIASTLDGLAASVRMPPSCAAPEAIARLNLALFSTAGFAGDMDDYDNPRNSLLHVVLERRKGLPILLSVVYMEVARRCGVSIAGIGFPGHFLIAPRDSEERFFIDAFNQGRILTLDALRARLTRMTGHAPTDNETEIALREVGENYMLVRINNNLKGAMIRDDNIPGAIRAVRRMLAVAPHLPSERRDLALMTAHEGDPVGAAHELQAYLDLHPDAPSAGALGQLAERLRTTEHE